MFVLAAEHPVLTAVLAVLAVWVVRFVRKGYFVRKTLHGQPGPPHSWLWGHLKIMGELVNSGEVPTMVHPHVLPARLQKKYNLGSYFYMDLWPIADPLLAVFDPDLAAQFTTDQSFPKFRGIQDFMIHLAGPGDLVSSDGPHWKKWRSIFNPGFAGSHLMTLAPGIVDDGLTFVENLTKYAEKKEAFRLEEAATRLTVDIIGKVALDMQLNTQRADNPMVTALRDQVHLVPNDSNTNPIAQYSPFRIYRRWRNSRIMTAYIDNVLEERFAHQAKESASSTTKQPRKRAIIDLALESYRSQLQTSDAKSEGLDPDFKKHAITQIRIFIFAGHDTTSSAICYAIYLLQKHPEALARIRAEHDEVLGSPDSAADTIKADPYIVNKLHYTTAVIKEALRLFPAGSSLRKPDETNLNFIIRDPKSGETLPTVPEMLLWVVHWGMHRDSSIWGADAAEFKPSRFMPENAASLPEAGYRPFEKGIRNCIGQDLAMLEARIVLALVARRFDFTTAFDALEVLARDGSKYAENPKWRQGKQDLDGEVAYPVLIGSSKPREGMPMWVREREVM